MGNYSNQNRAHINSHNKTALVEQQTIIDDSLLPSAEELLKLKEIDPSCIEWIKDRTAIEQNARIKFNNDRIKLANKELNGIVIPNILSVIFAFIIVIVSVCFSAYLIYNKLNLAGTIFGGGTIMVAAALFLKQNKQKKG